MISVYIIKDISEWLTHRNGGSIQIGIMAQFDRTGGSICSGIFIYRTLMEITSKESKRIKARIEGYSKSDIFEGHIPGTEFYKSLFAYSQNQLFIVPKINMVSNIGVTSNSVHAPDNIKKLPKKIQQLFNMETYEYKFPLKHPEFIIRDLQYDKKVKKIMGYDSYLTMYLRLMERMVRYIYYRDFRRIYVNLKKKLMLNNNIEK